MVIHDRNPSRPVQLPLNNMSDESLSLSDIDVQQETTGRKSVRQMFEFDDLLDFKVQIRLTMLELKLKVWPSIPNARKPCYSLIHKMGLFKPPPFDSASKLLWPNEDRT